MKSNENSLYGINRINLLFTGVFLKSFPLLFLLKSIFWLFISIILIGITLVFFTLQASPHVEQTHFIDANSALKSKRVIKNIAHTIKGKNSASVLTISQAEMIGLSALAHRAMPTLSSDIELTTGLAKVKFSLALPLPQFIQYLNVSTSITNSNFGLVIGDVSIGGLTISGQRLLNIIVYGLNFFVKDSLGDEILNTIRTVFIVNNKIVIGMNIPLSLTKVNNDSSPLALLRDKLSLMGDVGAIRRYYRLLTGFANNNQPSASLKHYIVFLFTQAQLQIQRHDDKFAVKENKAALAALSLYFGSNKFSTLVGNVGQLDQKSLLQREHLRSTTSLKNRVDLQKHFVYSIALQLMANSEASDAIGEIKELLDANEGGSGFSFADLLADRAGTRLAMLATQSESSAIYIQSILSTSIKEAELFPEIIDLPEGISQQKFEQHYQNINSTIYKEMLMVIDERLRQIPLYMRM